MSRRLTLISLLSGVLLAAAAVAQAPSGAPAGATGLCRDGTYWTGATKQGACHGHKGVQDWYASAGASSATTGAAVGAAPATAAPATVAPAAPAPAAAPAQAPLPPAAGASKSAPSAAQAPGGGPGLVWVNTSSKVYHCPSDRWYGKTKQGAYMSESDAIAKGNRPDHGKACK